MGNIRIRKASFIESKFSIEADFGIPFFAPRLKIVLQHNRPGTDIRWPHASDAAHHRPQRLLSFGTSVMTAALLAATSTTNSPPLRSRASSSTGSQLPFSSTTAPPNVTLVVASTRGPASRSTIALAKCPFGLTLTRSVRWAFLLIRHMRNEPSSARTANALRLGRPGSRRTRTSAPFATAANANMP